MKKKSYAALLGALVMTAMLHGAPPAAEDFSHEAAYRMPELSPDGKTVAYAETVKGEHRIYLLDLATKKKTGLELLGLAKAFAQPTQHFWVNSRRLVYFVPRTGTFSAVDRDGSRGRSALQAGGLVYNFHDEKDGRLLLTGREIGKGEGMGRNVQFFYPNRPFVHEVKVSGPAPVEIGTDPLLSMRPYQRVVENPGSVLEWIAAPNGEVRAAKEIKGTRYRTLFRLDTEAPWAPLPGLDWEDPQAFPLGFSADGGTLYVGRVTPEGTWGVFPYDLSQRRLGEPIIAHKKYDIVHPSHSAYTNGINSQSLVFSPKERALLGVRYHTEYPRMLWLDAGLAEVQAGLDQALPNKVNSITSMSDDLQRLIVLSWSAQDPGTYFFFDRREQKLEKLLMRMPWIKAAEMAETIAIRFKARDGVVVNGYLTLPAGVPRTNLPLVVVPHNFTWGRHGWGFDGFNQFIASRGYAVLEVDFRGSVGYGEAFRLAATKRGAQFAVADCADGARWAVAQKLADPARIAIVGQGQLAGSYALMSLALEGNLYRCATDGAGFTDWTLASEKSRIMPDYVVAWREKFGDPAKGDELAALREISPINLAARIKAPVLITHDKLDDDWQYNQSKRMAEAIRQAGGTVEFLDKYDEEYGYLTAAKYMNDTLAFLQKHMPAK